jgi:hypothetical protein
MAGRFFPTAVRIEDYKLILNLHQPYKFIFMKRCLLVILLVSTSIIFAQSLKSPSEFLGYELGSQFTRHHRVVDYYNYLSEMAPDQMRLTQYGSTNEGRPLLLAYLSSTENMVNLEEIREKHQASTSGSGDASMAIVWLSYNVHGNESVSTEASMQTIYELLTVKQDYLANTVVIIDPCINPDGRDRYVNWYKQFRNTPYQVDPNSKEHHEGWWNGRSNHYMFDLNRDWAWLTQVESRQRLIKYNEWLPHIHVDFHEQGVDAPYYFAPAAEPFHEVITDFQRAFQITLGKNHARYFDQHGWLYFTKEVFDLFYPSYGDTYPTYNGAIGMTYEQGGSGHAGLAVRTRTGDTLTLKDRIAHHHTTGLSTVEVAAGNTERLNREFEKFYRNNNYEYKTYVVRGIKDKLDALSTLLDAHQIEYGAGADSEVRGFLYGSGKNGSLNADAASLVISTDQVRGTLVKVLFEPNARLSDSLTYDITAWSLPYAYGLEALATDNSVGTTSYTREGQQPVQPSSYGYLADWDSMKDARFLAELLQKGIRVRRATKPFTLDGKPYARGSLIILKADNKHLPAYASLLETAAETHTKQLIPTQTGFVEEGKDFGSGSVQLIKAPKVAILGGEPTNTLDFGEVWHFFEQQLHYPLSVVHREYLDEISLTDYDIFILPGGGDYNEIYGSGLLERLKDWVEAGGKLIAMEEAIEGLGGKDGFGIKTRDIPKDSLRYEVEPHDGIYREAMKDKITGAIFKTDVDPTHPLAFGYGNSYYSLKLWEARYEYLEEGTVVYIENSDKPVAGFAGSEAIKNRDHTMVLGVEAHGQGSVIYFIDNPLFRGFWENGKLFFANALFMVE